jgi:hypothetical protein
MNNTLRKSPNDAYKARVKAIKEKLPKNFREIIYEKFPKYNTAKGAMLINNVVALRSPDITLTEILEQIAANNSVK